MTQNTKPLWIIRISLWVVSLGITIYWIAYSFYLYAINIHDPHEYATILRPRLYACFAATAICLLISGRIGAMIRRRNNQHKYSGN